MTWTVRDIVLPIDPSEIKKRTIRLQQPVASVGNFPDPALNQPTRFELEIKGLIWPRTLAKQLDEATKNAETEDLLISVDDEPAGEEWLSGSYSVTRSEVSRNKPTYTDDNGVPVEVYEYRITFAKFADAGINSAGDEGGTAEDEPGAGFFDIQTLGFDANGDGDIDVEDIFNFFNGLITFGATG